MQCAVRRRRCSSLDNIDMEQQQQSLFDVSIIKLQHEQLRHGVEPRLLRFVLINNALRSLQGHMLHIDDEETLIGLPGVMDGTEGSDGGGGCGGLGSEDGGAGLPCESSDIFFYNTFKNGSLSSIPLSPPTPAKVLKLDNGLNSDQSPLVEFQDAITSSPCPSQDVLTSPGEERVHPAATFYDGVGCGGEESDEGGGRGEGDMRECGGVGEALCNGVGLKEKRLQNGYSNNSVHVSSSLPILGKRSRAEWSSHDHDYAGSGGSKGNSRGRSLDLNDSGGGRGDNSSSLGASDPKKVCKPSSLIINSTIQKVPTGLNGLSSLNGFLDLEPFPTLPFHSSSSSSHSSTGHSTSPSPTSPLPPHCHHSHFGTSPTEESDKDSLTPSPIDFTNVDPTLYDFDTAVLQVESTGGVGGVSALEAQESGSLPNPLAAVVPLSTQSSSHVSTITTSGETLTPATVSSTATSSSLHLSSHLSSSPLQSAALCSPPASHCPSPLGSCSSALSTDQPLHQPTHHQLEQGECTSCDTTHGDLEASSETEKLSLVSADSTVLTAVSASPGGSPKSSCSMEAIVRAQSGDAEVLSQNGGSITNSSSGGLSTSPERAVEPDFLDEIEHIVELLMT